VQDYRRLGKKHTEAQAALDRAAADRREDKTLDAKRAFNKAREAVAKAASVARCPQAAAGGHRVFDY
jgi:hypothetical protein